MSKKNEKTFEIRDERPHYIIVDRNLFSVTEHGETWAALLQPTCVTIYACLCRHASTKANTPREAFPSYATMARECGVSRQSVIDGVAKLLAFGFIRQADTSVYRTNTYVVTESNKWIVADMTGRKARKDKGVPNDKRRKQVNQIDSQQQAEIVNYIDSDSQSDRPLIINQIDSNSQYDRPEVKTISKDSLREDKKESGATTLDTTDPQTALSQSPVGKVYQEFFGDKCLRRLNIYQVEQLLALHDAESVRKAIHDLLCKGIHDVWRKIPLIQQRAAEIQQPAKPPFMTPKATQRQQNLNYLNSLLAECDPQPIDAPYQAIGA